MSLARGALRIFLGVALTTALGAACSSDGGAGSADVARDATSDAPAAVDARLDVPAPEDLAPGPDEGARPDAEAPTDTGGGAAGVAVFRFGTEADQPLSSAPFPNDLYFEEDGTLGLSPLEDDPLLKTRAKREVLASWNALVDARTGFGTTSAIWFFTDAAVDPATLAGAVQMITLDGPEQGREIAVQAFWSEGVGVGVFPAWGDYLVPGSRYAVVITRGVRTPEGEEVATPAAVRALLAAAAPADAALGGLYERWEPLRQTLDGLGRTPEDVVVATVFTTQEVLPYARRLFDAVDAFALVPPTRRVSWDGTAGAFVDGEVVEGASALDEYFGVPVAPFETNPGVWLGARESAAALPDQQGPYTGGSLHARIARVVNGSIEVPVFNFQAREGALVNTALRLDGGVPQADLRAIVPFTLYLCDVHADDPTAVPVGIFSHGGGATRVDAIAWANGNCRVGVATLAIDMVFHGGRRVTALHADGLVVPTAPDVENAFSGRNEGDPGYVPDRIGDDETAVASVAPLYAVGVQADPAVIEANLLTIAADTATLLRYVREGDWSRVLPGLSFDADRIFHESVSFGTSFHTPLLALEDGFAGLVGSVGSGYMLTVNLLMAPVNAAQAGGVLSAVLGLKTGGAQLMTFSLVEPVLALHQWLQERGDPMPYAPYLLRHRVGAPLPPVVHSGNSWDETLYSPAQLSYAAALGLPVYTAGAEWTIDPGIPGAERLAAQPAPGGPLSGNAVFEGGTTTAGIFFRSESCHGMVNTAVCKDSFEHPYPPVRLLPDPVPKPSPICALHAQLGVFLASILDGGPAEIVPPAASCDEVY